MTTTVEDRLWQRGKHHVHFQNEDMDYYLMWMLAYQTYEGSQHGECLHAASRIEDGNAESWVTAWLDLARRIEAHASDILEQGHEVSAGQAYLRASTYYRAASVCMLPSESRFYDAWQDMRSCFRIAASLFEPPIEPVEIPFEGKILPGYFVRGGWTERKRPTVIMVGGSETFAEELYFWAGAPGARRGYNSLLVDLPGQGGTPFDGLHSRADVEVPIAAVIDYVLKRPDVDPDKLAIHGISGGGYIAARVAAYEPRIKACVLNPPVMDLHRLIVSELPGILRTAPTFVSDALAKLAAHQNALASIVIEKLCWQTGVDKLSEALERAKASNLYERVHKIKCPVLCVVGEGEQEEQVGQANEFYQELESPKEMRVFTEDEGAETHCQVNNLSLMHQVVYDWLDGVL